MIKIKKLNFKKISFCLILLSLWRADLVFTHASNEAGHWISWSCSEARKACIGTACCLSICGNPFTALPLMAICIPAVPICSVILSGVSDYCTKDCNSPPLNTPITYCSQPGLPNSPITDPTQAALCCQPAPNQAVRASPYPTSCPSYPPDSPLIPHAVLGLQQAVKAAVVAALAHQSRSVASRIASVPHATYSASSNSSTADFHRMALGSTSQSSHVGPLLPGAFNHSKSGGGGGQQSGSLQDGDLNTPASNETDIPTLGSDELAVLGLMTGGGGVGGGAGLAHNADSVMNGPSAESGSLSFEKGGGSPLGMALSGSSAVLLSEDPLDYFTRIDLDEDLFKRVHARYQKIGMQWKRIPSKDVNDLKS